MSCLNCQSFDSQVQKQCLVPKRTTRDEITDLKINKLVQEKV